jgi:hypothetical protein
VNSRSFWMMRFAQQPLVRRILRKYGYPPDKRERATQTVLEHLEASALAFALRGAQRLVGRFDAAALGIVLIGIW